jgi:hypothetical protein
MFLFIYSYRFSRMFVVESFATEIKKLQGLVRQRTIPTERPPLVGEDSANFNG